MPIHAIAIVRTLPRMIVDSSLYSNQDKNILQVYTALDSDRWNVSIPPWPSQLCVRESACHHVDVSQACKCKHAPISAFSKFKDHHNIRFSILKDSLLLH